MSVDYVELDATQTISAKATNYAVASATNGNTAKNNDYVNATRDTEYYIVNPTTGVIKYFVGRNNVTTIPADNIAAAYAVATDTSADSSDRAYWVADVIVIELNSTVVDDYDSVALAYYYTSKTSGEVQLIDTLNSTKGDEVSEVTPAGRTWASGFTTPLFYEVRDTDSESVKDLDAINSNYNSYGIYAGVIDRINKLNTRDDYINLGSDTVNSGNSKHATLAINDVPVWYLSENSRGVVTAKSMTLTAGVNEGDRIIYVYNGNSLAYIVDVTASNVDELYNTVTDAAGVTTNLGLWLDIWDDQNTNHAGAPNVTFYGQSVTLSNGAYTGSVTNSVAKANAALDDAAIVVTNGKIVMGDTKTEYTTDAKTYTGTILGDDGKYYSFTLTQNKANSGATLTGTYVDAQDATKLNLPDPKPVRIETYLATFGLAAGSENATIEWTIKLNDDSKTYTNADLADINNASTDTIASLQAVVTSEDESTTNTYTLDGAPAPTPGPTTSSYTIVDPDKGTKVVTGVEPGDAFRLRQSNFGRGYFFTITDGEGNYYSIDTTKTTIDNVDFYNLKKESTTPVYNYGSAENTCLLMPTDVVDLTITNGYLVMNATEDRAAGAQAVYALAGDAITVTGRCDTNDGVNYNTGVLRGDYVALLVNGVTVQTVAIVDGAATFNMPDVSYATYKDNITVDGVAASVKAAIDGATFEAGQTWNQFKAAVEAVASTVPGVMNFTVTGQVPGSAGSMDASGTNITVEYTYNVGETTQTGSTVVTLAA
jgi:hypothetical protein